MTAAGRSPPPVPSPIREITSAGTRVFERSTNRTPSGKSPSNAWATRTPSLVLPTPPGPVRVSSRWDRRIVTAFSSSSRRPTSDVKGMGSRWIGWLVTAGRSIERRVLAEDPAFELLDLGRWVDAELIHQGRAQPPVRRQRIRLSAGSIERKHQLAPQPFAKRVFDDERAEFGRQAPRESELELGFDTALRRRQAQLLEARDLGLEVAGARNVRQRGAAPQRERAAEAFSGVPVMRQPGSVGRARQLVLEPADVELGGGGTHEVSRRLGDDPIAPELASQSRHVGLQRGVRCRWGVVAPQRIGQARRGDRSVRLEQKGGQQCRRLGAGTAMRVPPSPTTSSGPSRRYSNRPPRSAATTPQYQRRSGGDASPRQARGKRGRHGPTT